MDISGSTLGKKKNIYIYKKKYKKFVSLNPLEWTYFISVKAWSAFNNFYQCWHQLQNRGEYLHIPIILFIHFVSWSKLLQADKSLQQGGDDFYLFNVVVSLL